MALFKDDNISHLRCMQIPCRMYDMYTYIRDAKTNENGTSIPIAKNKKKTNIKTK